MPYWKVRRYGRPMIAVVTAYNHAWSPLGALTAANKRGYCMKQGYGFIEYVGLRDEWHPSWLKLPAIRMGLEAADVVFWTDADSLIVNPDVRLEDLYDRNATLTITDDGFGLNAGNFFVNSLPTGQPDIKTTGEMFLFLMDAWRCKDSRTQMMANLSPWDQRAVVEMMDGGAFGMHGITVSITDRNKFNSYDPAFYEHGTYQDGDFLLHYPGHDMAWKMARIKDQLGRLANV